MYEIIADPKDYNIGSLEEGLGHKQISFSDDERKRWAEEIEVFAEKLDGLSDKAKQLQKILAGENAIQATPASLKTFKVQLFKINNALNTAFELAKKLETDFIKK
jgi:septal ring factor EnvC (AmiA/AmiB activator)